MLGRRSDLASDSYFSSNSMEKKIRSSTFFNVPGVFVGFTGKGLQDSDSAKSPTSPLDHRLFSNLSSSLLRSPRSPGRSWECSRVGLGLVDSLSDESKTILLGSQMRIVSTPNPKPTNLISNMASSLFSDSKSSNLSSLPTFFSGSLPVPTGSINGFRGSLSASEIELSEDYTCIISHGSNPKTTHIFGDCILENYKIESLDSRNKPGEKDEEEDEEDEEEEEGSHWIVKSLENLPSFPSNDFLSFCCFCKKKLEVGRDIYMYRGEKAFCSYSCREQEMLLEEEEEELEREKPPTCLYDPPSSSSFHEDLFL